MVGFKGSDTRIKRSSLLGLLNQLHVVRLQFLEGARDHRVDPPRRIHLGLNADPLASDPKLAEVQALLDSHYDYPANATWQIGHMILTAW